MLLDIVTKGSTDRSVLVRVIDSTDGTPETGVAYNTAGVDLWYRREGATKTSITEATLATTDAAHADGGFIHIADGYCRLDLPDAAFATGANYVDVGGTFTGMVVIGGRVRLAALDLEAAALDDTDIGPLVRTELTTELAAILSMQGIQSVRRNTAQAGAAGAITLDASASSTTDYYVGMWVMLNGGTGSGQVRAVTAYNGTTKVASVAPNWATTPDNTSTFAILSAGHLTGVQGNVTGSVGSVASGGITAASFGANAITAAKLDPDVTTELQSGLATAASLTTVEGKIDTLDTNVDTLLTRITSTLFSGITSLAEWLGLMAGKQTGNSTARTEIRATGAGSGTYDETTDSQEATRDATLRANVKQINDVTLTGDGSGTPWGPA